MGLVGPGSRFQPTRSAGAICNTSGPSLAKQTDLTERLRMKVPADFFNAFNHLNFLTPSTSLYSPTSFGVVTVYNSANAGQNVGLGPRRVHVSLRVEF